MTEKRFAKIKPNKVRSEPVYHGSNFGTPEEFMKAPVIHVGTREQANQLIEPADSFAESSDKPWSPDLEFPGVHKLNFSQFAEFHPNVMSDAHVNAAHQMLLHDQGLRSSDTVSATSAPWGHPKSIEAYNALKANKIVPYHNKYEVPHTPEGIPLARGTGGRSDAEHISYLVPSPSFNMSREGGKDPLTQPTLPMDLSMVVQSEKTKSEKNKR